MRSDQPLPHGGIEVLVDLITHQDLITWTVLSVFLAADVLLIGLAYQVRAPFLALIGFIMTVASLLIVSRSDAYLTKYLDLAKQRVHPEDLPIFNVKVPGIPTLFLLVVLHTTLGLLWIGLYVLFTQG